MEELRASVVSTVTKNMDDEEVQAYFNREHPDHEKSVAAVTAALEDHFGDGRRQRDFFDQGDEELRQALYDDERSVRQQLEDIFNPKSEAGRAYCDSNHPKHAETVRKAQILMEAKFGEDKHSDPDSRMPVHYKTGGQNVHQVGAFPIEED